jgi:hypothetical protein
VGKEGGRGGVVGWVLGGAREQAAEVMWTEWLAAAPHARINNLLRPTA